MPHFTWRLVSKIALYFGNKQTDDNIDAGRKVYYRHLPAANKNCDKLTSIYQSETKVKTK